MALSRRFYQKLASRYLHHRPPVTSLAYPTWAAMVESTAAIIDEEASGFKRSVFLLAAGIPVEVAAPDAVG